MSETLKQWMLLAAGVIVISSLIFGAMIHRAENMQQRIDTELSKTNN